MRRIVCSLIVALLPALLWPGGALALLTGSAEWNWAEYQRDVDGGEQTDLSHFFQQYSLLYRDRGTIQGGRAGGWDVGLGFEWTTLDASLNDEDVDFNDGKILYQGDFRFTPAGLPLQLQAYSQDLTRSIPVRSYVDSRQILESDIYQGIYNGQHIASGITLLAGGPSASLMGDYRLALTALPRLLIDYREDYVRDLKSTDPQHYRMRDLAFVSLNRKNNWFHYRTYEFTDFIDADNDYKERSWLLGTIDQLNRRQWIKLTNWLNISADFSLTERSDWRTLLGGDEDTYRLNLFSVAKRRDWNFANYTTFARTTGDNGGLEKEFEFPLLASGVWDPQSRWKGYFLGTRWEQDNMAVPNYPFKRSEDTLYAKYQIESKRYAGRILTPEVEADWARDSRLGEGQAARVAVELRSDNRLVRLRNWLAACSAAWFDNTTSASTYSELTGRLAANSHLSPTVAIGGSQDLAVGFGDYTVNVTRHLEPTISQSFQGESESTRALSSTSYRATTNAYLELTPPQAWQNRFSVYFDLVHIGGEDRHQFRLQHDASYAKALWQVHALSEFSEGDDLSYRWQAAELISMDSITGVPDMSFFHQTEFNYLPNRSWDTRVKAQALWGSGDRGSAWLTAVEQRTTYHLYQTTNMTRRWLSLEERFDYQKVWGDDSTWYANMELFAVYYATRYLTLNANVGVRHYGLTEQNEFEFGASAEASFRKLQVNLSYAYGFADEGTFLPGVREQRWEVGLKKIF